jgi:hypothetical protein
MMGRRRRIVALVALPALVLSCGQVDPVIMTVAMPDCVYQGPISIMEGNVRLSLTLNGLGDAGAGLVRFTGEETYDSLVDHLGTVSDRWDDLSSRVEPVVELRLSDREGVDGVEETARLDAGRYAVICIDHPYDGSDATARPATSLEVAGP